MQQRIFTVGHSTHEQETFIGLLNLHGITAVCDVRSKPYSRVNPQFNREQLQKVLPDRDILYLFLGKELGGRSDDPFCYERGKLQYERLARTELFQKGLQRVREGMGKGFLIALMCGEKEPVECHRTILIARHLVSLGLDVQHIHSDGRLESHADALHRLSRMLGVPEQHMFLSSEDLQSETYRLQEDRIAYGLERVPDVGLPTFTPAAQ